MTSKVNDDGLRSPFEQQPQIIEKIGLVVTLWGTINNMLRSLTADVLECSFDQSDIVLSRFSGEDAKLKFIIALLPTREIRGAKAIIKCLGHLADLSQDRNLIIHGGPIHGGNQQFYPMGYHYRNFKSKQIETKVVPAEPLLDAHIEKLRRRGAELWTLVYAAQNEALDSFIENVVPTLKC